MPRKKKGIIEESSEDEEGKLLPITEDDLSVSKNKSKKKNEKLTLEHKEAILSKLRYSCSGRQDSINKIQSVFAGIWITLLIFIISLPPFKFFKSLFFIKILISFAISVLLILIMIGILKKKKHLEKKEEFGNQIEEVQKSIREELKGIVKHDLKETGNLNPISYPVRY